MHNKAVAEYYKSDLKKTDQFKKALNAVFTQVGNCLISFSLTCDIELHTF